MKAILVPVGTMPREIEVDGLAELQKAVGGNIEPCWWVFNDKPAIWVNDEGKFTCEPNRAVYATDAQAGAMRSDGTTVKAGDVLDVIYGDFVCIGFDAETGEDRDITDEEAQRVRALFGTAKSIESGWLEVLRIRLAHA